MAGEEPAEGSQSRRRLDLNLYTSVPPLSRRPCRLGGAMGSPVQAQLPEMPIAEVPRTDELAGWLAREEIPLQPAVYSSSNALSVPELSNPELSLIDPMIIEWLDGHTTDGEHGLNAGEPAALPSNDANVSPPLPSTLTRFEGVGLEWVERLSHPVVVPPAIPVEMVSTMRGRGGAAIEEMTPELRLQRIIQVSEQHRIVSPGPVTHNQQSIKLGTSRGPVKDGNCRCNSTFHCYICLEAAKEPVVTPCGHLFCWPCLYQWLHGRPVHSKCPVCKEKVLELNIIPIYGRSGDERDASNNDVPPRPHANRTESLRHQLQTQDPRGTANMVWQFIENQGIVRANSVAPRGGGEVTVLLAAQPRGGRVRQQQRQDNMNSAFPVLLHARNTASPTLQQGSNPAPQGGIQVPMPSSSGDNAALAIPQQSSSMDQASTSSTVPVIVGQAAQSRRSRPSESTTTTRRTRRRRQQQQ
ncbi:uncharacterized protein LOC100845092 [Brachypodium distachyon]|nr:uncharacterized protein LOC100845092 [Brachypodium distachyon]|eukprot:XP_003571447.1 uncharacterized protein LOC100845092 [Brachypodium distachyon]